MAEARPLRLAFVAGQLSLGGAERQLALLVRGLRERGDRVAVACASELVEPYGRQLREAGVEVAPFRRRGSWDLRRLLELRRWLLGQSAEVAEPQSTGPVSAQHFAYPPLRLGVIRNRMGLEEDIQIYLSSDLVHLLEVGPLVAEQVEDVPHHGRIEVIPADDPIHHDDGGDIVIHSPVRSGRDHPISVVGETLGENLLVFRIDRQEPPGPTRHHLQNG